MSTVAEHQDAEFWEKARAFADEIGTGTFTISWEEDGMVFRDDQGNVVPDVPDWMTSQVNAWVNEEMVSMAGAVAAHRAAHPEDYEDD